MKVVEKPQLDELIHAPKRLEICAFLVPLEEAEFQVLRGELDVSDSVLSKHLARLESARYVTLRKATLAGRKRTWIALTPAGRAAFAAHVDALRNLLADVQQ